MESPELTTIRVAGGATALAAMAMVVSRSNGPRAASRSTSRWTAVTLPSRIWLRRGPYSTWPSARRGVRGITVGCPVPGATT